MSITERVYVNRTGDKVWSPNTKEQLCEAVEELGGAVRALTAQRDAALARDAGTAVPVLLEAAANRIEQDDLRRIFAADLDAFELKWLGTKGHRVADIDRQEAMLLWRIQREISLERQLMAQDADEHVTYLVAEVVVAARELFLELAGRAEQDG